MNKTFTLNQRRGVEQMDTNKQSAQNDPIVIIEIRMLDS